MGARSELDGGAYLLFAGERRELFEIVAYFIGKPCVEIVEAFRIAVGEQPDDAFCFRSKVVRLAGAEVVQRVRVFAVDACDLVR